MEVTYKMLKAVLEYINENGLEVAKQHGSAKPLDNMTGFSYDEQAEDLTIVTENKLTGSGHMEEWSTFKLHHFVEDHDLNTFAKMTTPFSPSGSGGISLTSKTEYVPVGPYPCVGMVCRFREETGEFIPVKHEPVRYIWGKWERQMDVPPVANSSARKVWVPLADHLHVATWHYMRKTECNLYDIPYQHDGK